MSATRNVPTNVGTGLANSSENAEEALDEEKEQPQTPELPTEEARPKVSPTQEPKSTNLNFILEPWDWRKDCCLAQPLIFASIESHWIVHVRLPPGLEQNYHVIVQIKTNRQMQIANFSL